MAISSGGIVFGDDANLQVQDVQLSDLGQVGEVVITKDDTLLLKGKGCTVDIDRHVDQLREKIKETTFEFEKQRFQERLARLVSSVAILKIGGSTKIEVNEKKDRVKNALNATRAAIMEGIIPDGEAAFSSCIPILEKLKGANSDQVMFNL